MAVDGASVGAVGHIIITYDIIIIINIIWIFTTHISPNHGSGTTSSITISGSFYKSICLSYGL